MNTFPDEEARSQLIVIYNELSKIKDKISEVDDVGGESNYYRLKWAHYSCGEAMASLLQIINTTNSKSL